MLLTGFSSGGLKDELESDWCGRRNRGRRRSRGVAALPCCPSSDTESRIAAAHEILEAFRNVSIPFQDESNATVMLNAMKDFNSLEEIDRVRAIAMVTPMLRVWEEAFYQHQSGRLENAMWGSMSMQYSDFMAVDTFEKVWALRRHVFSEQFRAYVDNIDVGEYRNK